MYSGDVSAEAAGLRFRVTLLAMFEAAERGRGGARRMDKHSVTPLWESLFLLIELQIDEQSVVRLVHSSLSLSVCAFCDVISSAVKQSAA